MPFPLGKCPFWKSSALSETEFAFYLNHWIQCCLFSGDDDFLPPWILVHEGALLKLKVPLGSRAPQLSNASDVPGLRSTEGFFCWHQLCLRAGCLSRPFWIIHAASTAIRPSFSFRRLRSMSRYSRFILNIRMKTMEVFYRVLIIPLLFIQCRLFKNGIYLWYHAILFSRDCFQMRQLELFPF